MYMNADFVYYSSKINLRNTVFYMLIDVFLLG